MNKKHTREPIRFVKLYQGSIINKTPAQAFTPPVDEKKMGTIWIFGYYGSGRSRCRCLKVGKGLDFQKWDLNRAHETERTVFPIPQVFGMRIDADYDIKQSITHIHQTVQ